MKFNCKQILFCSAHLVHHATSHFPPLPVWIHALKVKLKTYNDPILSYLPFFLYVSLTGAHWHSLRPHSTTLRCTITYMHRITLPFSIIQQLSASFHFRFCHFSMRPFLFTQMLVSASFSLFVARQFLFSDKNGTTKENTTTCASIKRY